MAVVKVQKIEKEIDNISYSQRGSAGIDLRASGKWVVGLDSESREIKQDKYELKSRERILIKTGIKIMIPEGHWGNIRDRSGLAFNHGLHVMAGVVDENYRGEVGVVIVNLSKEPYEIKKNERIAQMVVCPCESAEISYEEELGDSNRGENGFGSSGR